MAKARPRIFFGWYIVGSSFFLSVWTGGIFFYGFTAFFNPILEEFGWSRAVTSFLYGWRDTLVILAFDSWLLCLPLSLVLRHRHPYAHPKKLGEYTVASQPQES